MIDIIFSASIIASFLAGMVALFAPCCITVLLPAYLGSAFREKKNILKMTFVFFIGMSIVLIPIGLGAAGLAQLFRNFHQQLYIVGGLFMLLLAGMSLTGRGMAFLPMSKRKIAFDNKKSVLLLGIFSGAATSCCAPVLAGAMTLAVLSGAFWKALIVTFAYVFGMTIPLFIAAYFYDRFKLQDSRLIKGKTLSYKSFSIHSTNLLAAGVFLIMGVVLLVIAFSGNAFWSPEFQAKLGQSLNEWSNNALGSLTRIPDFIWGTIILGLFLLLIYKALWKNKIK